MQGPRAHLITMTDSNSLVSSMWEDSGIPKDGASMALVVTGVLWALRVGTFYQTLKKYFNVLITDMPVLYISLYISLIVKFAFLF